MYDNSGLSTLVELFESIVKASKASNKSRTLILLSINANADEYDSFYANKIPGQQDFMDKIPLSLDFPIRYKAMGYDALNLIHYVNKRRAEEMAISKMQEIFCNQTQARNVAGNEEQKGNPLQHRVRNPIPIRGCNNPNPNVRFLYFPVNLAQLSPLDQCRIQDPSNLYDRLKKIPTNFVISDEDNVLLGQAAELIMTAEQDNGWNKKKGESTSQPPCSQTPSKETVANLAAATLLEESSCDKLEKVLKPDLERLDEAFAFYVLCTAKEQNTNTN